MRLGIANQSALFQSSIATLKFVDDNLPSGKSYKASTIIIYNSRVVADLKIPHITTPDL